MKFTSLFTAISVLAGVIGCNGYARAAEVDDDGFPVFYLRGDYNGHSWNDLNARFTRNQNEYSLKIADINGRFKISNDDWTINYGAQSESDVTVYGPVYKQGVSDGLNFQGVYLENVVISFTYIPGAKSTEIKFVVNGVEPKEPTIGSGTLPILYINVYDENGKLNNEIISKDLDHKNYFTGEYWLDVNGCEWMMAEGAESIGSKEEPLPLQIKARGNWTRIGFSKKPFKLKLDKKESLLGLSKSKHFAILAHAEDHFGYLRNFTGFNLGRRIGLPWTPDQKPVEVVINGDYRGLYFLTESIRIEKDRINITELDDNVSDPSLISGGYLVELDNYDEDNQIRMVEKGQGEGYKDMLRITFDTPEEYSNIQRRFVTDQFTAMNDAIGENSDVLWSYMDLDDAARYYVVEEIISHTESYHGSTYLFRDRGEGQKWHFSPLWDCGNAFMGPTDNYFTSSSPYGNTWISSLRLNNKFMDKVKETWKWFMSNNFDGIYQDIDLISYRLKEAAQSDFLRWNGQPVPFGGQPVVDNRDMDERAMIVKNHLKDKINWLSKKWGAYVGNYPEPSRDATPAAPLPEYVLSGIECIEDMPAEENAVVYNLQGIRVSKPEPGQIYIICKDGKTRKVLAK